MVDPERSNHTRIFIGATVTVADEEGEEKTYSIAGVDETHAKLNRISGVSPMARALMKHEEGDVVTFRAPGGDRELEIVRVEYVRLDPPPPRELAPV